MAAVDLDTQQVYGGSLPVSAAGRFCLSHSSQCGTHQSQQHSGRQEPQALDHRSHSFPLDMRGASHLSVNPADWVEAPQPQTSRQSVQKEACPPPPSHAKSACQLHDSPKSAWRQSLQQFDQTGSLDSAASEMTIGRKRQTVLVWDLDETLILFHSLLSGAYAVHHSPEKANEAMSMGKKWQESILDICDQHFFFTEIENFDQTTSTALQQWDDHEDLSSYDFDADRMQAPDNEDDKRKLAYRFRRIAQLYGQGIKPLAKNSLEASNWNWLYNATDKLTKGWLTHGAKLLQQVTASAKSGADAGEMLQRNASGSSTSSWQSACGDAFGHTMMDQQLSKLMQKTSGGPSNWIDTDDNADVVNVLVTTGQLVPTLGKLLLFKLDGAFKATSVYSARNEGKAHCFDLIAERFGSDCNYVAIGDGAEEQRCAEQRQWPFVKVNLQSKPDATAKIVDQSLAAFPSEGGLLTNMQAEHLTSLWS